MYSHDETIVRMETSSLKKIATEGTSLPDKQGTVLSNPSVSPKWIGWEMTSGDGSPKKVDSVVSMGFPSWFVMRVFVC